MDHHLAEHKPTKPPVHRVGLKAIMTAMIKILLPIQARLETFTCIVGMEVLTITAMDKMIRNMLLIPSVPPLPERAFLLCHRVLLVLQVAKNAEPQAPLDFAINLLTRRVEPLLSQ